MTEKEFTTPQHANRLKQAEAEHQKKEDVGFVKEWVEVIKKHASADPIIKLFRQTKMGNVYSYYVGKLKSPGAEAYVKDAKKKGIFKE